MDESEQALFREIAVNYGDHNGLISLNNMLLSIQSMARRLQAAVEHEEIIDEHDAALIADELAKRLDAYVTEQLADLIGMTIMTEAASSVSPPPEVIHISMNESGDAVFGGITLSQGMSIIGQYGGLDFEVRNTELGYVFRPMIIVETPSLSSRDQPPHIFSDGGYIMIPLDCDSYEYTGLSRGEVMVQPETIADEDLMQPPNIEQLIKTCDELEERLNNETYSHDVYSECYGALQCYLDENGLTQDSEVRIVVFGVPLNEKGADSELVDSLVLVEKPTITRQEGVWRIQLQFSVVNGASDGYALYGVSPRNILSIGHK